MSETLSEAQVTRDEVLEYYRRRGHGGTKVPLQGTQASPKKTTVPLRSTSGNRFPDEERTLAKYEASLEEPSLAVSPLPGDMKEESGRLLDYIGAPHDYTEGTYTRERPQPERPNFVDLAIEEWQAPLATTPLEKQQAFNSLPPERQKSHIREAARKYLSLNALQKKYGWTPEQTAQKLEYLMGLETPETLFAKAAVRASLLIMEETPPTAKQLQEHIFNSVKIQPQWLAAIVARSKGIPQAEAISLVQQAEDAGIVPRVPMLPIAKTLVPAVGDAARVVGETLWPLDKVPAFVGKLAGALGGLATEITQLATDRPPGARQIERLLTGSAGTLDYIGAPSDDRPFEERYPLMTAMVSNYMDYLHIYHDWAWNYTVARISAPPAISGTDGYPLMTAIKTDPRIDRARSVYTGQQQQTINTLMWLAKTDPGGFLTDGAMMLAWGLKPLAVGRGLVTASKITHELAKVGKKAALAAKGTRATMVADAFHQLGFVEKLVKRSAHVARQGALAAEMFLEPTGVITQVPMTLLGQAANIVAKHGDNILDKGLIPDEGAQLDRALGRPDSGGFEGDAATLDRAHYAKTTLADMGVEKPSQKAGTRVTGGNPAGRAADIPAPILVGRNFEGRNALAAALNKPQIHGYTDHTALKLELDAEVSRGLDTIVAAATHTPVGTVTRLAESVEAYATGMLEVGENVEKGYKSLYNKVDEAFLETKGVRVTDIKMSDLEAPNPFEGSLAFVKAELDRYKGQVDGHPEKAFLEYWQREFTNMNMKGKPNIVTTGHVASGGVPSSRRDIPNPEVRDVSIGDLRKLKTKFREENLSGWVTHSAMGNRHLALSLYMTMKSDINAIYNRVDPPFGKADGTLARTIRGLDEMSAKASALIHDDFLARAINVARQAKAFDTNFKDLIEDFSIAKKSLKGVVGHKKIPLDAIYAVVRHLPQDALVGLQRAFMQDMLDTVLVKTANHKELGQFAIDTKSGVSVFDELFKSGDGAYEAVARAVCGNEAIDGLHALNTLAKEFKNFDEVVSKSTWSKALSKLGVVQNIGFRSLMYRSIGASGALGSMFGMDSAGIGLMSVVGLHVYKQWRAHQRGLSIRGKTARDFSDPSDIRRNWQAFYKLADAARGPAGLVGRGVHRGAKELDVIEKHEGDDFKLPDYLPPKVGRQAPKH